MADAAIEPTALDRLFRLVTTALDTEALMVVDSDVTVLVTFDRPVDSDATPVETEVIPVLVEFDSAVRFVLTALTDVLRLAVFTPT